MINLLIVAPTNSLDHHVPAGFIFIEEVFAEAGLKDTVSKTQRAASDLERTIGYLARRYPGRIRIRWVNPWSLGGIWITFRYRIRSFPAIIVNQKEVLTGKHLQSKKLQERVEFLLSQTLPG